MDPLVSIFQNLWQIVLDLGMIVVQLLALAMQWSLLIAWLAWWLLGVNWRNLWPALAKGAWAPVVLLIVVSALVWSRIAPGECNCLGFVTVPNFWWQLGAVSLLVAVTLFCGWLQGLFGWTPPELSLDPPAHAEHGHDHGH
jgi:hypothetical protein